MAKDNLFLGQARGKIGDIVLYRMDGRQMARTRNRNPRNPRTEKQQFQRAIMATIAQAYSVGKAIFDHSFQGKSVGAWNQRRFSRVNADKLRAAIANDIANNVALASQIGRVVAPNATYPVAFPYIISEGSYPQNLFSEDGKWPAPATGVATLGAYADQLGLIAGDYYTIVAFIVDYQGAAVYTVDGATPGFGQQFPCKFGFIRMKVKDSIIGSSEAISGTPGLRSLFDIDAAENLDYSLAGITPTSGITLEDLQADGTDYAGGFGIIRSRKDQDLRSNSEIVIQTDSTKPYGLVSQYVLDAWMAGTQQLGNSELILEGGRGFLVGGGDTPGPTPFVETLFIGSATIAGNPATVVVNSEGKPVAFTDKVLQFYSSSLRYSPVNAQSVGNTQTYDIVLGESDEQTIEIDGSEYVLDWSESGRNYGISPTLNQYQ